jgi:uncharacterized linocin/CFP29 family protein
MLTDDAYNLYYMTVLEEIEPLLVGPRVVSRADSLPPGTQQVTRDELHKLKGKAKRGRKGSPVPRELGEMVRKTTFIPEHIHGFDIHQQDLLASKRSRTPLPQAGAQQCARLVAESIEDMIFNGIPELNIPGVYKYAGKKYPVQKGNEWNRSQSDPYSDIIKIMGMLGETSQYKPKFMVLGSEAYYSFLRVNSLGLSFLKMVEDAGVFPDGRGSIFISPAPANLDHGPIIPPDGGLIGDFGPNISERYVQNNLGDNVTDSAGDYTGEISLVEFPMDKNNMISFNVQTYQGIDIHYLNAYVRLENLIAPPET